MKIYKTIEQLWIENGRVSKGLVIKSHTSTTPKFYVRQVMLGKGYAIVESRGKGIISWFRKFPTIYRTNNPRWELVKGKLK